MAPSRLATDFHKADKVSNNFKVNEMKIRLQQKQSNYV